MNRSTHAAGNGSMLPNLRWALEVRPPLTQWYGHVRLLPERVLGPWYCVDREHGTLLWQTHHSRVNTIRGVVGNVIIADEMRSDGPWTIDFGCYGLSLETGRLLWTSHRRGWWGQVVQFLDLVPGFTNEFRDTIHEVIGSEIFCVSGRVLDPLTGAELRRLPRSEVPEFRGNQSDAYRLFEGIRTNIPTKIPIGNGSWLSHKVTTEHVREPPRFFLLNSDDTVVWEWDVRSLGMHLDGNYYSYRYVPHGGASACIYFVLSEGAAAPSHQARRRYHLVSFSVSTGRVLDDILVDDALVNGCRIEDADDRGLLISLGDSRLQYYEWAPS